MAKAIRFHQHGGPEALQVDDIPVADPGPGQVRIRHTAIGVNFVDTYQRSGLYPMQLPMVAGNEAAGVVEAVGKGVKDLKAGDRVAYTGLPGSYCEARVVPAERMVKIPKGISDEQAASMMLKGMTVHYLIFSTYKVKKGETVTVTVRAVQDAGLDVQVGDDGAVGFVKRGDLGRDRDEQRPERFQVGQKFDAMVVGFDRSKKPNFSVKALQVAEEKQAVAQYGSSDSGASLGDILGAALKEAQAGKSTKKK